MKLPGAAMRAVRVLPERARQALSDFFRLQAAGGILLMLAALLALVCANSPLEEFYELFRNLPVQVRVGELDIDKPLLLWVNDGLMAVFFLLVALEIKREVVSGQLSSRDQFLLPMLCALGGVLVPALIYWQINRGDAIPERGWAIPAATDIAFALGVLSLLGKRVPLAMKLLLSTIAVLDDLIAILVIAAFYSSDLSGIALAWVAAALVGMLLLNRRGVTALTPYLLLGVVVWVSMLKSGVHATLAGVLTAMFIPHVNRGNAIDDAVEYSPLESLEHALHPWVAFGIMPVFAFANAGLALGEMKAADLLTPVPLGIVLGLLLGKPIGIVGMAMLARATGLVRFPEGIGIRAMIGLGLLCGIGFTMGLFIASLAFADSDLFHYSVLGVLCASTLSAALACLWLWWALPKPAEA